MQRNDAISLLKKQFPLLHSQYGVEHLSLFGSVARNEASSKSDIDLLVEFSSSPTFDRYMDLKFYLEDLLHTHVDLVTKDSIRRELRKLIEKEIIHVA
jgi:predicted nucleotidyltransferase